jgi:hypothetical protein
MAQPLLIPKPVTYLEHPGRFPLRRGPTIVLSHAAEQGEWIAARAIQAALAKHSLTVPLQPQRHCLDAKHTIVLAVRGRDEPVFPSATGGDGQQVDQTDGEAYTLTVREDTIALWAAGPKGVARGAQTLCQLVELAGEDLPAAEIQDTPAFPLRGVLHDVSRGKVPTLPTIKRLIDMLYFYKINMLQLYVEHTFASRRHPNIGAGWGALTPEELVEVDRYCRERYIEFVPCLQSFGHLRHMLELPAYRHLAESAALWSVTPALEDTYQLLGDLYADFLACFSSPYFNICSDETYDLGMGQSRDLATSQGKDGLFLRHILRLHTLAAEHGRTIMVWDDMFLHYPHLLRDLPPDTIVLNWWYEAQDHYPQIDVVHAAGLRQLVCPGTSSWNTLFPRLDNARANIRAMVAGGRQASALEVLNTDWGDNGHPNLLSCSWHGFAFGAAESWSPGTISDEEFDAGFARFLFGHDEAQHARAAMQALAEACILPGVAMANGSRTVRMFFGNPLDDRRRSFTDDQIEFIVQMVRLHGMNVDAAAVRERLGGEDGPVPDDTLERMVALAATALGSLAPRCGMSAEAAMTLDEWRFAARQLAYLAASARLGRAVVERAGAGDATERVELAHQLGRLKRDLHELRREYERLWLLRNKPEGLWLTLDQLDVAAAALDGWLAQVQVNFGWS